MKKLDYIVVGLLFASSCWFSIQAKNSRTFIHSLPVPFERATPLRLSRFSLLGALGGMRRAAADWSYIEQLQYSGDPKRWRADAYASYRFWGDEILWLDPTFHHAIEENAVVLGFTLEHKKQAMDYLKRAVQVEPGHHRYSELIGAMLYDSQTQPTKAIAMLQRDVLRGNASEMLLRIVGNIYLKYEDWAGAKKYWSWMCGRVKQQVTIDRCLQVGALLKKKGF